MFGHHRSGNASCSSRTGRDSTTLLLDPEYDDVLRPTVTEQCSENLHETDVLVTYSKGSGKCKSLICSSFCDNSSLMAVFSPNENTNCGDGKVANT